MACTVAAVTTLVAIAGIFEYFGKEVGGLPGVATAAFPPEGKPPVLPWRRAEADATAGPELGRTAGLPLDVARVTPRARLISLDHGDHSLAPHRRRPADHVARRRAHVEHPRPRAVAAAGRTHAGARRPRLPPAHARPDGAADPAHGAADGAAHCAADRAPHRAADQADRAPHPAHA
ncbi:hypothetical protein ACFSTC_61020 [Nonomuraea ferruginea]